MNSQDLKQAGLAYLIASSEVEQAELALSAAKSKQKKASDDALAAYKVVNGELSYDDDEGYASGVFHVQDEAGEVFAIQLYEDGVNSVTNLWIL